jgi:hypothetical protein
VTNGSLVAGLALDRVWKNFHTRFITAATRLPFLCPCLCNIQRLLVLADELGVGLLAPSPCGRLATRSVRPPSACPEYRAVLQRGHFAAHHPLFCVKVKFGVYPRVIKMTDDRETDTQGHQPVD